MTGIYIRFHRWRGFSLMNAQPDLFNHVYGLGFVTIYVCKRCLYEAYCKLRDTIGDAISKSEEGR